MRRTTLSLVLATGCVEQVQPVEWEPLDIEALDDELGHPTGELTDEALARLLSTPLAHPSLVASLLAIARLPVEHGLDSIEDFDRDLDGTQIYLRVACPGPLATDPDPQFRFGTVTTYSPLLDGSVLDHLGDRGDVFGVVEDCGLGAAMASGGLRTHYELAGARLAVAFELTVVVDGELHEVEAVVLDDEASMRILHVGASGETLVIEQTASQVPSTFTVRGRDGEVECAEAREPRCWPLRG